MVDKHTSVLLYRGIGIYEFKGSECFILKFALPPFSPPLPSYFVAIEVLSLVGRTLQQL